MANYDVNLFVIKGRSGDCGRRAAAGNGATVMLAEEYTRCSVRKLSR